MTRKNYWRIPLITAIVSLLFAANVAAEDLSGTDETPIPSDYRYDGVAEELFHIGILRGDGVSFNLDAIPDRIQACVMVVRMRGEEAAALAAYEAGEITCPFTDIDDSAAWAKPYLAWLYEKRITLGTGDGKFGNGVCTAQMYATFMLRALGYADTGADHEVLDFSFADALSFAENIALWDHVLAGEAFSRGIMAAVTYQTLAADVKNTEFSLLESLVLSGAVNASDAQPILAKTHARNEAEKLIASLNTTAKAETATLVSAYTEMNVVFLAPDPDETVTETIILETETACDGESATANGILTLDGEAWGTLSLRYRDGTLYTELFGNTTVTENATLSDARMFDLSGIDLPAYYAMDSYAKGQSLTTERADDGGVIVTCCVSDWLPQLLVNVLEADPLLYEGYLPMQTDDITMTLIYAHDGTLTEMKFTGILLYIWDFADGTSATQQFTLSCHMKLEATGDAVVID